MARTFTIAEILTEKQIADLFAIYKKEGTNHHKAMMEYIEASEEIARKLNAKCLLVDYFAYVCEYVFSQSPN